MSQSRDVVSNLQQTAQDIINYMLTYRSETERLKLQIELDNIFTLVREKYTGDDATILSLFQKYFIFPFSRRRHNELDQAIHLLKSCPEEQFARFVIVIDLLRAEGACKSTSLNTIIIDKLIAATGKYNSIQDDKCLDARHLLSSDARESIREKLKDILTDKATKLIMQRTEEQRKEEEFKHAAKKVERQPQRLVLSPAFVDELEQALEGKYSHQKPLKEGNKKEGNKLDKKLLAERHAMLQATLGKRVEKQNRAQSLQAITGKNLTEVTPKAAEIVASVSSNKLRNNPAFANSLNAISTFFAAKQHKKAERDKRQLEEDQAIWSYFGV